MPWSNLEEHIFLMCLIIISDIFISPKILLEVWRNQQDKS